MRAGHTLPAPESSLHSLPLPARRLHACLSTSLTTRDEASPAASTSTPRLLLASLPPVEPPAARAVQDVDLWLQYLPRGASAPARRATPAVSSVWPDTAGDSRSKRLSRRARGDWGSCAHCSWQQACCSAYCGCETRDSSGAGLHGSKWVPMCYAVCATSLEISGGAGHAVRGLSVKCGGKCCLGCWGGAASVGMSRGASRRAEAAGLWVAAHLENRMMKQGPETPQDRTLARWSRAEPASTWARAAK